MRSTLHSAAPVSTEARGSTRLHLAGNHRLPAPRDPHVLVDVLHDDVWVVPEVHRFHVKSPFRYTSASRAKAFVYSRFSEAPPVSGDRTTADEPGADAHRVRRARFVFSTDSRVADTQRKHVRNGTVVFRRPCYSGGHVRIGPDSTGTENAHCTTASDSGGTAVATMTECMTTAQTNRARTIRELYELIAALDRRVPQVERLGEVSIARAAATLKIDALKRIEELQREAARVDAP
jgi:hypothetical protein